MATARQSELGDFLRSRRQKLTPKLAGVAAGRRRRTPGLRREEVAELAGIGVDWYIRLEQGRSVSPSATTIDALARALRLSKAEHAHLRALARDGDRRPFTAEVVPPAIRRAVESLNQPAYVTGRRWDVLAWNAARGGDFRVRPAARRRAQHPGPRADQSRDPAGCLALAGPARRSEWWRSSGGPMIFGPAIRPSSTCWRGSVPAVPSSRPGGTPMTSEPAWPAGRLLNHPKRGRLSFEHASFQANDDPGLKLIIYTEIA